MGDKFSLISWMPWKCENLRAIDYTFLIEAQSFIRTKIKNFGYLNKCAKILHRKNFYVYGSYLQKSWIW